MNTNLQQQQAGRRLNWTRISGMGFAGAFHIAAFMVVLAPSAPIEGPPPKPEPMVVVPQDVKREPPPPIEVPPVPEPPPLAQPQESPVLLPPIRTEVVIDVPPVLQDVPHSMAFQASHGLPSDLPEVSPVPDVGPSVAQDYDWIAMPPYPERARARRQEGRVMLRVLVGETGNPLEVQVESSSGHRVLDMAALKAVRKWKFNPGLSNGQPIQGWVLVPINFSLK